MLKNVGLVWLKDDFRLIKNLALIEATEKHSHVVAFFLYKKPKYDNQEAQTWWVGKSISEFKKKLNNLNINLEVIQINSYKSFFEKLFLKKNFSIYWNKSYEPNYLEFDKFLIKKFNDNGINYNIYKGNILNEFNEIKKNDGTPFKVFTPYWKMLKNFIWKKFPQRKKVSKCIKKISFLKKL